jgi:hypothetical protein
MLELAALLSLTLNPQPPAAVRGPPAQARRGVLALGAGALGLALPHAAARAVPNPFNKGELTGLKPEVVCKPKGTCACNCMPDGFGGYKERAEEVKPVASRVIDAFGDEVEPPPAPRPRASVGFAPPSKGREAKPASSSSSALALSFDELVANSVANKEELVGRKLSDAEVGEIRAKVARFTSK